MLGKFGQSSSNDSLSYTTTTTVTQCSEYLMREIENLRLAVVKISNIAWEVSSGDVVGSFTLYPLDKIHIHIPIDRTTGKTKAEMYVELPSIFEATRFISKYNRRVLRGRSIGVSLSSLEELYNAHFPKAIDQAGNDEFLSEVEAISLVNICRNYKAHFSRKCAERPFEHVLSVLRLTLWYQMETKLVDRMFFIISEAIEALLDHLQRQQQQQYYHTQLQIADKSGANENFVTNFELFASSDDINVARKDSASTPLGGAGRGTTNNITQPTSQIGPDLLGRLLKASDSFPAFSEHQKMAIKKLADPNRIPRFGAPILLTMEPHTISHKGTFSSSAAVDACSNNNNNNNNNDSNNKMHTSTKQQHLRRSSIDRILAELNEKSPRTDAVNKMMKEAFEQIMLSLPPPTNNDMNNQSSGKQET